MDQADEKSSEFTEDVIYDGRLTMFQPRAGFRFALDSLLLGSFARVKPGQRVIDLGTGVGVIALTLALRMGQGLIFAVEIQSRLADCARRNVKKNDQSSIVKVLETDWTDLTLARLNGPVDHVICNPPYRELGAGRLSPAREETIARHELKGGLPDTAQIAAELLTPSGLFSIIYPAARLTTALSQLRAIKLEPKRLRLVHTRPEKRARLALVEARLQGGEELEVIPPLIIYEHGEIYSPEAEAIFLGKGLARQEVKPDSF
ncbi:MAG: methyltransferase [Candidatus Adiutricales bacterium]